MTYDEIRDAAASRLKMCQQLREMIVSRLDMAIDPAWITDDQPLFGRGLELDSIDTLELILGVESEFDVSLTEDDRWAFGSVAKLAERIAQDLSERATAR